MKDIIPLDVDTSRWKPGRYVRGKMVRSLSITKWLKRHEPCLFRKVTSRQRWERTDGFKMFIFSVCNRCKELYILDEVELPFPFKK